MASEGQQQQWDGGSSWKETLLDALDCCVYAVAGPSNTLCGIFMRLAGPAFVIGFYYLMGYHTWVFLTIIASVLRKRVGTEFAVIWTLIGIVITYNVVWNHLLAMCLRPGSPKDLIVRIKFSQLPICKKYLQSNIFFSIAGRRAT